MSKSNDEMIFSKPLDQPSARTRWTDMRVSALFVESPALQLACATARSGAMLIRAVQFDDHRKYHFVTCLLGIDLSLNLCFLFWAFANSVSFLP